MKSTSSFLLLSFVVHLKANRLLQSVTPSPTCSLPAETGVCRARITRYFYNSLTKQCETFIYGGCGGNDNNFETQAACQAFATKNCDPCPNGCLSPITGECSQLAPCPNRPYCQTTDPNGPFYMTCPAYPNANCNFNGCGSCGEYWTDSLGNIVDCNADICTLPADVGPCDGAFYNYFYNSKTGKCDKFTFGGCDGNANNFETLGECRAVEAKCNGLGAGDSCGAQGSDCIALGAPARLCSDGKTCFLNCGGCIYTDDGNGGLDCSPELTPQSVCPDYCETADDCAVKNVGNCCGYFPGCVNVDYEPDLDAVKKECEEKGLVSVCGFVQPSGCSCNNNQCDEVFDTIAPKPVAGDSCGTQGVECPAIRAAAFTCPDGKTCYGNCGTCTYEDDGTGNLVCSNMVPRERVCPVSNEPCGPLQCRNDRGDCQTAVCGPLDPCNVVPSQCKADEKCIATTCSGCKVECVPGVGCGIDNCIKYTDKCNECTCNEDGTASCTEKACIEAVVFVNKCLECEFGYRLDENDKCVKKIGCENNSDCDRPNGFKCRPDPICRGSGRNNPNCTPRPRVCYAKSNACTSDADCDVNNGFKCVGINNQGTGVCTKYQ